ncbi:MAG: VOC family protein [Anaerolineae bacterium]
MNQHEKLNYVEIPAKDIPATKTFFETAFGWRFEDYGPDYTTFYSAESGLDGGFFKSDLVVSADNGSIIVIFYSQELDGTQAKVESAGGKIIRETFEFPGGRRFHFTDPSGNEFAVWSDDQL